MPAATESDLEAAMTGRRTSWARRRRSGNGLVERLATGAVFVAAAARYWLLVFPRVSSELRHWRRSAARISDPVLRRLAFAALEKRSNMEGAAAFAAFVRFGPRRDVVRALVAFQAIYNHVDMLAEQRGGDQEGRARALHEALLLALEPGAAAPACRAHALQLGRDDEGHLAEMIETCRWALSRLPGFAAASPTVRAAARRIVAFQSLSLGEQGKLEEWALHETLPGSGLDWWETAAAAGSSLAVHALIAASASPALSRLDVEAIDNAYSSSIGALHSLLDSVVDEAEDAQARQLSLIGCYGSRQEAAARLGVLTERTIDTARDLPDGRMHALVATAMACSYLGDCERTGAQAAVVAPAVRAALGDLSRPVLRVFALRRLAARLAPSRAGREARAAEARAAEAALRKPASPAAVVDRGNRGAGARAT
jgi:tetraprenyl-beta-curcumene synthase